MPKSVHTRKGKVRRHGGRCAAHGERTVNGKCAKC